MTLKCLCILLLLDPPQAQGFHDRFHTVIDLQTAEQIFNVKTHGAFRDAQGTDNWRIGQPTRQLL